MIRGEQVTVRMGWDESGLLELPFGRSRRSSPSPTSHPALSLVTRSVPAAVSSELTSRYLAQSGGDREPLGLAALAALLWRYTGQDQVPIQAGRAGGTGVLRFDFTGAAPSFGALVAETRLALTESRSGPGDAAQVAMSVQARPEPPGQAAPPAWLTGRTHLCLDVFWPDGEGSTIRAWFSEEAFERTAIERMLGHFSTFLAGVADRDGGIDQVGIVPEDERAILLDDFNDTLVRYPTATVVDYVEAQAAATPDAIAVVADERQLTYSELDEQAGRAARALLARPDRESGYVAIFMDRSLELVVALLAVLKAGLAYVPIETRYPAERVRYLVEDSGAFVVITQEHLAGRLAVARASSVLLPDLISEAPASGKLERDLGPETRIYMIYTSGSTGRPKGVVNRHRSLFNKMYWMQEQYRLGPADRVLQKTPYSFDVSFWEFLWPLMFGATLVMARPEGHREPGYLRSVIREHGITVIHFVPSMLRLFLDERPEGLAADCRSLRMVFSSGEALPYATVCRFFEVLGCELHNLYGPTEAAIEVAYWRCTADEPSQTVPIGRPVANTVLYVVDGHRQLQPIGVPGELCIGGVQLAEGYHRRDDLTRAAFVPSLRPHEADPRMYLTGDLARYRPDGQIEYLGRLDNQIKLRGVRIELGEIEAALRELPGVEEAAVALRGTGSDGVLVAYVVADQFSQEQARESLARQLPDNMVPHIFVRLGELPLLPNGKLDRRALADQERAPAPVAPPPPAATRADGQGEIEQAICRLVAGVLDLAQVSPADDFFEIGGHSMAAMKLVAAVTETLGVEIDAWSVFEEPTAMGLAKLVAAERSGR